MTKSRTSRSSASRFLLVLSLISTPVITHAFWSSSSSSKKTEQEVKKDDVKKEIDAATPPQQHDRTAQLHSAVVRADYGADMSFPMQHHKISTNYPWLPHNVDPTIPTPPEYKDMPIQPLGNRQKFYDDFLQSCLDTFGSKGDRCTMNEQDRIAMSLRQPQSMQNYTDIGFTKIKAPQELWNTIKSFWEQNKNNPKPEEWGIGNIYTNNWQSASSMVSVEDTNLRGGGHVLKQKIWDAARTIIQEWTGEELTQCSLYGVRVYYTGSILSTHVDRLPLVSSAIINVDQDLDEPWPLEVIGHDGHAYNVTMEPGDMVLYESHSILHGRPFPLKGKFMANLFVHFEPTGHSLRHNARVAKEHDQDVHEKYRDALKRGVAGHENDNNHGLPSYIIPGSVEEEHWRATHPTGQRSQIKSFTTGSTPAHTAAQKNDLAALKKALAVKKDYVNAKDENGWTPLHEGARFGHMDVVKELLENGADVNALNNNGATPLWWANQQFGKDHPMVQLLEAAGAIIMGPEL